MEGHNWQGKITLNFTFYQFALRGNEVGEKNIICMDNHTAFTPLPSTIENDGDDGNFSGNEFWRTSFKLKKEKKIVAWCSLPLKNMRHSKPQSYNNECKMPNDYEILWLGLENWLNQVSGQFPRYNDPEGNLISSFTKHRSHSTFCIWHLANTEHRGKGLIGNWAN